MVTLAAANPLLTAYVQAACDAESGWPVQLESTVPLKAIPVRKFEPAIAAASATFCACCQFTYITATSAPSAIAPISVAIIPAYRTAIWPPELRNDFFIDHSIWFRSPKSTNGNCRPSRAHLLRKRSKHVDP